MSSRSSKVVNTTIESAPEDPITTVKPFDIAARQYILEDNGDIFRPCSPTIKKLNAGLYYFSGDNYGVFIRKLVNNTGDLLEFKDSVTEEIVAEFHKFWQRKSVYEKYGEPFKRGFLLWGPPGGGKTCTVGLIIKKFIDEHDGVVFNFSDWFFSGFPKFRQVEPERKVLVVLEDIDSYVQRQDSEQVLLQFLDGDAQFSDIVVVATTNYPEYLGDRIINRPSRFDRVIYVGMPTEEQRIAYISAKKKFNITNKEINKWVKDTDGWTFAHIKELITAVEVFGNPYDIVLDRINLMRAKKSSSTDYERELRGRSGVVGFGIKEKR